MDRIYNKIRKDYEYYEIIYSIIAFNLFLNKQDKKLNTLYQIYGNNIKIIVETIKFKIRDYLRKINEAEV